MEIEQFNSTEYLLEAIKRRGLEFDQRLSYVFESLENVYIHCLDQFSFYDAEVVRQLFKLNARCASLINPVRFSNLVDAARKSLWPVSPDKIVIGSIGARIFNSIIKDLSIGKTIGTTDFIKAVIDQSMLHSQHWLLRPHTADILARMIAKTKAIGLEEAELEPLLADLERMTCIDDDFDYILTFNYDRIAFRVTSVLDDYYQEKEGGLLVPKRALLTHFEKQYAFFSRDQIEELEELINDPNTKEKVFQHFFEKYPHFFRKWDCREVHPQIYLTTENSPLIPDFILTDNTLQKAFIIDIKRPQAKLIRHQDNRVRFANAVMEARAQLLEYQRYFENPIHRRKIRDKLGMEIYHPHLAVIIGRASEFQSALERQKLTKDTPDIEVVTYDDILAYASERRLIIES